MNQLALWAEKKTLAMSKINDAARWLKSGKGINWIPDNISTAVYYAVEGWLNQCGYTEHFHNNWEVIYRVFRKYAPQELLPESSYILSKSIFLENELMGDSLEMEFDMKKWSIESWKEDVHALILRTKDFIEKIEEDLSSQRIK